MLDKGANPFIKDYNSETEYDIWSLSKSNLKNLPKKKSIYFPVVDFGNSTLLGPWQYSTGVFPGKFNRVIGSGGEGLVVQGIWNNNQAAFKWVSVGEQEERTYVKENIADIEKKLSEMRTMQTTIGTAIMPITGHFR